MNYPTWHSQVDSLLIGNDLIGYIDGSHPCPSDNTTTRSFWKRQDQLLLHAIRISVSDSIATLIASTKSSKEAWDKLKGLYANQSRSRVMTLIDVPLLDDDLVIHILNGVSDDFKEITARICARENPISFEDLHDKLIDFDAYLKQQEARHEPLGHTAKRCSQARHFTPLAPTTHYTAIGYSPTQTWLIDSATTNHVTSDLQNLSLPSTYDGPDNIKNLIFVSQFCKSNLTSIEFFPTHFDVKDLRTREILIRGLNSNDAAYKCFDPSTRCLFLSHHVVFDESVFPYPSYFPSSFPTQFPPFDAWFPTHTEACVHVLVLYGSSSSGQPTLPPALPSCTSHLFTTTARSSPSLAAPTPLSTSLDTPPTPLSQPMSPQPASPRSSNVPYIPPLDTEPTPLPFLSPPLVKPPGSHASHISRFINALSHCFSVKDLGFLHYFLGVEVIPTTHGLFLTQQKYIRDLLVRTHMDGAKEVSTPLPTTGSLVLHDGSALADSTKYHSVIGALQYLNLIYPIISFAVNNYPNSCTILLKSIGQPPSAYFAILKVPFFMVYFFGKNMPSSLHAYSDAEWAGNLDDRTFTTAYIVYLGGNPISQSSRKQRSVAHSSTEVEYRAIASTAAELSWIQSLLHELSIHPSQPPVIYCDNVGANYLADALTKPLSSQRLSLLRHKIGVSNGSTILWGRVKAMSSKPSTQAEQVYPYPLDNS
ncbi:hypothetical protein Acr_14g0004060 [Actinidia rufa]|uniref:Retroviral polymerase SH3-like domain-containing protein n=1 Tax=Actinidia rufa TaxID=165716 RepID=A0A7J0FQ52_9ERIC|nr:hypothetical protein Acr_14g0004060 [Actinidia rufa]